MNSDEDSSNFTPKLSEMNYIAQKNSQNGRKLVEAFD